MTRLTALVLPAALALAPALLPALASPALAATAITTGETAMGKVLTDGDGMTLYVFDKDSGTASACSRSPSTLIHEAGLACFTTLGSVMSASSGSDHSRRRRLGPLASVNAPLRTTWG